MSMRTSTCCAERFAVNPTMALSAGCACMGRYSINKQMAKTKCAVIANLPQMSATRSLRSSCHRLHVAILVVPERYPRCAQRARSGGLDNHPGEPDTARRRLVSRHCSGVLVVRCRPVAMCRVQNLRVVDGGHAATAVRQEG